MGDAGLSATELGPDGFLPTEPDALTALLDSYGLSCVGGFVPVVLHDAAPRSGADIAGPLDALTACRRRRHRARGGNRVRRLRLPTGTRRDTVGHAAGQPGSAGRRCRRTRDPRGAASARRHDGREPRRGRAGAGRVVDPVVSGHRPSADRRHRSAGARHGACRAASRTPISRTSTPRWPPGAVRRADLHRGGARGHVHAAGHRRRRHRRHRVGVAGQRLRRLVRDGAGHHPRRRARPTKGPCATCWPAWRSSRRVRHAVA